MSREIRCQCGAETCKHSFRVSSKFDPMLFPTGALAISNNCETPLDDDLVIWADPRSDYAIYGPRDVEVYCQCKDRRCDLSCVIPYEDLLEINSHGDVVIVDECRNGPGHNICPTKKGDGYKTYRMSDMKAVGVF